MTRIGEDCSRPAKELTQPDPAASICKWSMVETVPASLDYLIGEGEEFGRNRETASARANIRARTTRAARPAAFPGSLVH